jgi:hypothetical protein
LKTAWICLGRYGDICNALPLVWNDYTIGNRPTVVVSREFESLLDGISYADKLVFDGHYSNPAAALEEVKKSGGFEACYVAQCYGTSFDRECPSFIQEVYRLVGQFDLFDKLPLYFNRRSPSREAELVRQVDFEDARPVILVAAEGHSSPFPHTAELWDMLRPLEAQFRFLSLDKVRAERFYDLLGLYERARGLISIDTGHLHLAQATPDLPVMALVTHSPDQWHGSPRRRNHMAHVHYDQFSARKGEILRVLNMLQQTSARRFIHCYSDFDHRDEHSQHRFSVAKNTWEAEYAQGPWIVSPVHDATLTRTGVEVGDKIPVPFLHDVINRAALIARDHDVIVYTNDDNPFFKGLTYELTKIMQGKPAVWCSRMEFTRLQRAPDAEEVQRQKAYQHVGADLFAFTKTWWMDYRHLLPDFLIARECWDLCFRSIIDATGGARVHNLVGHEMHMSYWHAQETRECPGNLFNRDLCNKYFASHGGWPHV